MNIASAHQSSSALIQAGVEATKQQIEHTGGNQVAQINSMVKESFSNVQFFMETLQRSVQEGRVDAINSQQQNNIQLSRIGSQLSGLENLTRTIAENLSRPYTGAATTQALAQFRKGSDESGEMEHCEVYLIRMYVTLLTD